MQRCTSRADIKKPARRPVFIPLPEITGQGSQVRQSQERQSRERQSRERPWEPVPWEPVPSERLPSEPVLPLQALQPEQ